mmetsp:Transcript_5299/g.6303  ORF Transcript_5299/g.6303 Transcript_5299/m.6303 type:complete len:124 (-) Transcript_5299:94-465(-)
MTSPTATVENYIIYHFGKHAGTVDLELEAANLPSIRQMAIGVLTGHGVRLSSTPFVADNPNSYFGNAKKGLPSQMIEIYDAFQQFKKRDIYKDGYKKVRMSKVEELLNTIISLLKETDKASML